MLWTLSICSELLAGEHSDSNSLDQRPGLLCLVWSSWRDTHGAVKEEKEDSGQASQISCINPGDRW